MADLIIVCRNKRQAKDLYDRTCKYLWIFDHTTSHGPSKDILYVKDNVFGDSARFVTLYEIQHKNIDDGLHGIRIDGEAFDKQLDKMYHKVKIKEN